MIDYSYYVDNYGGEKIKKLSDFKRLSFKANILIDRYTFGRSKVIEDESIVELVKYTSCELIDKMKDYEEIGNLKSESVDDYSATFNNNADVNRLELYRVIRDNLVSTGLMYRG